jgi:hypothetical protein
MSHVAGVAERPDSGELGDAIELAQVLRAARLRQTPLPPPVACHVMHKVAERLANDPAGLTAIGELSASNVLISASGDIETNNGCFNVATLGMLLYECLTLRKVSSEGDSAPPSVVVEGIPPSVDAVVQSLLGGKLGSCDEVAAALQPVCAELGGDRAGVVRLLTDLESALPRRVVVAPHGEFDEEGSIGRAQTVIAKRATSPGQAIPTDVPPADDGSWKVRWGITVVAAVLAFTVPALLRRAQTPRAMSPVMMAQMPPPGEATQAVAATTAGTVHLRARGPEGALATLDDQPVGTLPLDLLLPSTGNVRQLVVTANRYRPWSRALAGNMDVDIAVDLVPAVVAPPVKRAATATPPAPAATATAAPAKKPPAASAPATTPATPAKKGAPAAPAVPAKHVIRNPFGK